MRRRELSQVTGRAEPGRRPGFSHTSSREATETLVARMFDARDHALAVGCHLSLDAERPVERLVADLLDFEAHGTSSPAPPD